MKAESLLHIRRNVVGLNGLQNVRYDYFDTTVFPIFSMWVVEFRAGSILQLMRLPTIWLLTEWYVQPCLDM
jgi:hypothetical protein